MKLEVAPCYDYDDCQIIKLNGKEYHTYCSGIRVMGFTNLKAGDRVKIVADEGKDNSSLIGQIGTITSFKWNKFRQENNLPVVCLDSGLTVSGLSLWFELQTNTQHETKEES